MLNVKLSVAVTLLFATGACHTGQTENKPAEIAAAAVNDLLPSSQQTVPNKPSALGNWEDESYKKAVATTVAGEGIFALSEDALHRIFDDVSVTTDANGFAPEIFEGDGTYMAEGRVITPGSYWISGGEVCIRTRAGTRSLCRSFGQTAAGEIYQFAGRRGEAALTPITPPVRYYFSKNGE